MLGAGEPHSRGLAKEPIMAEDGRGHKDKPQSRPSRALLGADGGGFASGIRVVVVRKWPRCTPTVGSVRKARRYVRTADSIRRFDLHSRRGS